MALEFRVVPMSEGGFFIAEPTKSKFTIYENVTIRIRAKLQCRRPPISTNVIWWTVYDIYQGSKIIASGWSYSPVRNDVLNRMHDFDLFQEVTTAIDDFEINLGTWTPGTLVLDITVKGAEG